MKKRIAMILCLVMALSVMLCGCGSEKDALIGSWTGAMDLTEAVNAALVSEMGEDEDAAEMAQYLTIDSLKINMTVTFNEDDTYSMVVDEASLEDAMMGMMDDMADGMIEYFEALLEAEGLDMTVEELLAYSGMSVESLAEDMYNAFATEDMFSDLNSEGNFKVSDGKLFLSDGLEYAVDEAIYELYTIEGNTLTIDKGTATDEFEEYIYPMVFTKD